MILKRFDLVGRRILHVPSSSGRVLEAPLRTGTAAVLGIDPNLHKCVHVRFAVRFVLSHIHHDSLMGPVTHGDPERVRKYSRGMVIALLPRGGSWVRPGKVLTRDIAPRWLSRNSVVAGHLRSGRAQ
jgi:hypothetical protein